MAARDVEQRAVNSDGNRNGGDGDVGDTTSGGNVNSSRVEAALLAAESQYMRYSRRKRNGDSPVSSGPPTSCADCPYRLARH